MWTDEKTSCKQCDKKIDKYKSSYVKGKLYYRKDRINKFCSLKCSGIYKRKNHVQSHYNGVCEYCNNKITSNKKYCNIKCYSKGRKGKKRQPYKINHNKERKKPDLKDISCRRCNTIISVRTRNTKYCDTCSNTINKVREKKRSKIRYKEKKELGIRIKNEIVKLHGGKCEQCGYNKCSRALVFHHKNPKDKLFTLDTSNLFKKKYEDIIKESEKCELLCANCHAIHHEIEREIARKNKRDKHLKGKLIKQKLIDKNNKKCTMCNCRFNYQQVFTFHHLDKNNKSFEMNIENLSKPKYKNYINEEYKKCILVCFNCHMEIES